MGFGRSHDYEKKKKEYENRTNGMLCWPTSWRSGSWTTPFTVVSCTHVGRTDRTKRTCIKKLMFMFKKRF